MTVHPSKAMILAAGLGTRMRPLTETTPKPLLKLCGMSLLDHEFERLVTMGVQDVVVNAHWQAAQIDAYLTARKAAGPPRTRLLHEAVLLDTGGSVQAALPHLGPDHSM